MGGENDMDGFDVEMSEVEVEGKKLKMCDDIDGKYNSLTVVEVGISQPHEGK